MGMLLFPYSSGNGWPSGKTTASIPTSNEAGFLMRLKTVSWCPSSTRLGTLAMRITMFWLRISFIFSVPMRTTASGLGEGSKNYVHQFSRFLDPSPPLLYFIQNLLHALSQFRTSPSPNVERYFWSFPCCFGRWQPQLLRWLPTPDTLF